MLASQAMVRNGNGRPRNEHGSEETSKSSSAKKKVSRRRRTPAERAKEKNEAVFWAFIEAEMKTEAAWARIDKLAASTEPHDAEIEDYEPERDLDGADGHAAFLEWELAIESGAMDQAFDEWLCESGEEDEDVE